MIGTVTKWVLVVYAAGLARYGVAVVGEHKTEAQCREAARSLSAPPTYWSCIPVQWIRGTARWPDSFKPHLPFMPSAKSAPTRHSSQPGSYAVLAACRPMQHVVLGFTLPADNQRHNSTATQCTHRSQMRRPLPLQKLMAWRSLDDVPQIGE
jgi:hypothetical protein